MPNNNGNNNDDNKKDPKPSYKKMKPRTLPVLEEGEKISKNKKELLKKIIDNKLKK